MFFIWLNWEVILQWLIDWILNLFYLRIYQIIFTLIIVKFNLLHFFRRIQQLSINILLDYVNEILMTLLHLILLATRFRSLICLKNYIWWSDLIFIVISCKSFFAPFILTYLQHIYHLIFRVISDTILC